MSPWLTRALLVPALGALLLGVEAGLVRMGFSPAFTVSMATWHGALMVHGLFGTLIGLERAVALKRTWAYTGPAASGIGVVALVLRAGAATPTIALLAFSFGAAVLVASSVAVIRKQPQPFTIVLAGGAFSLLIASIALASGAPAPTLAPSWIAFLVVTIAGERLELARLVAAPARAVRVLGIVLVALILSAFLALKFAAAVHVVGAMLILIALWLARYDIARRTVRMRGLPRFVAMALLVGYAWLAVGGTLVAFFGLMPGSSAYDAGLHAVFVGFVLSMVFAHAPIVLPAVARVRLPFHPSFYAPLVLLHASLVMRVTGDLFQSYELRRAGGLGHAFALVAFVLAIAGSRRRAPALEESHAT